jgi:hypothetical protein
MFSVVSGVLTKAAIRFIHKESIMTVRYTNYITFAWLRSDLDYEIDGTLNGETVEDDALWNNTVRVMLMLLKAANDDTEAYQREDVVAVLIPDEDEVWTPLTFNP